MTLKHAFTSSVADGADATLVRPSNWNADHVLSGTANAVAYNNGSIIGLDAKLTFTPGAASRQLRVGPAESTLDAYIQDSVEGYLHLVGTQNQYDCGIGVEIQGPDVFGLYYSVLGMAGSFASYGVVGSCVAGAAATPKVVGVVGSVGSNAAGAVTDAICLSADGGVLVAGGSITNLYGLKVNDCNKGSNNWAIKTGAGLVNFNDNVILGTVSTTTGKVQLAHASSAFLTTIQAGNAAAARTYTWPTNFGAAGTVLTDAAGNGTLSWGTAGAGDALTSNPLSQFAATTSLQLKGVISDETGSGALVFATSPTLVTPLLGTPTSGVLTNCTGTATGLTSGITNALKSATTTVDVSAATAPSSGQVLTATAGTTATWQTPSSGSGAPGVPCGRLTLTTGVPLTTSDVTAAATIYYTPYTGNNIPLWNGSAWAATIFTEVSLALGTISSGKPYDVFGFLNAGALNTELLAWTNTTTRATAITLQDGMYCKSGDHTRLWLGTFYTTATTTTEDSVTKRFVINAYNAVPRRVYKQDSTSHTYNGGYRQWNNTAANKVEFLIANAGATVSAACSGQGTAAASGYWINPMALDSTTTFDFDPVYINVGLGGMGGGSAGTYQPTLGYHYIAMNEGTASSGTGTFTQSTLSGTVLG